MTAMGEKAIAQPLTYCSQVPRQSGTSRGLAMVGDSLSFALRQRRSIRKFKNEQLDLEVLDTILFALDGSTASDGRRTAPSANGLYPLTSLFAVGPGEFLSAGVYAPSRAPQGLTRLSSRDVRSEIAGAAIGDQEWIGSAACIITIFGDVERASSSFFDQPPTGKRGERYVYLEAGAAAQNVLLQATCLGVGAVPVGGIDEEATAKAYGKVVSCRPLLHVCLGWPLE